MERLLFIVSQSRRELYESLRVVLGQERDVEVILDDLGDPRFQSHDATDGELGGEHPAQPLVLGRVEPQQVSRALGLLVLHRGIGCAG